MCIENFQFVFDGKSIDVGNGKRSKSSNEEEVALEAIYSKMRMGIRRQGTRKRRS